jgi:hypothetical protein
MACFMESMAAVTAAPRCSVVVFKGDSLSSLESTVVRGAGRNNPRSPKKYFNKIEVWRR